MPNITIFQNYNTLAELKSNVDSLSSERGCLFNRNDSIIEAENWLNALIDEYNQLVAEDKKNETTKAKEYNVCLFKTFEYLIPFLSRYGQLFAFSNKCILSDDDSQPEFHARHFLKSIEEANRYHHLPDLTMLNLSNPQTYSHAYSYYVLGFMNFRAQNYDIAKEYLLKSVAFLGDNLDDYGKKETFVSCIICLANCYEYTGNPEEALYQLLGVNVEQLNNALISNQNSLVNSIIETYNSNTITKENIKDICSFLVEQTPKTFAVFELPTNSGEINNKFLIEFVHILAHSLSEYSAKKIYDDNYDIFPIVSLVQIASRFLIDWVTKGDNAFITCQATVRAENDACREALNLLMQSYRSKFPNPNEQETDTKRAKEKAELEFYIFYFAEQELRYNYKDRLLEENFIEFGDRFKKYAQDCNDNDSLFYYYVIHFKFLLKKNAEEALLYNETNDYKEIDEEYINLTEAKRKELRHVFKWLIEESTRLENLYLIFRQFRYLNNDNVRDFNMHEFFQLLSAEGITVPDNCEEAIVKKYDDIEKRNKILILAPVKEAPSCAFGVRNIDELLLIPVMTDYFTPSRYLSGLSNVFSRIESEHRRKDIEDMLTIKSNEHLKNVKWAIAYRENDSHFFIYYKNHGKQIRDTFPVLLFTDNETKKLISLMETLISVLSSEQIPLFICKKQTHKHVVKSNCYTRVFQFGSNPTVSKELLNLLVFFEFDFYTTDNNKRLQNGDCILISNKSYRQREYKIVAFSSDISSLKSDDVCNFVELIKPIDASSPKEVDDGAQLSSRTTKIKCRYIDFKKAKRELGFQKPGLTETDEIYMKITEAENNIDFCESNGTCRDPSKKRNGTCELNDRLSERGINCLLERIT